MRLSFFKRWLKITAEVPGTELTLKISPDGSYRPFDCNDSAELGVNPR